MEVAGDVETKRQAEKLSPAEPATHLFGGVAFENAQVLLQCFGQGPVRDAFAVGQAPSGPAQRLRLDLRKVFPELAHEARLSDTGIARDRGEDRSRSLSGAVERSAQSLQLRVAADERARETADTARAHQRERPNDAPGGHAAGLPLRLDCFGPAELERPANRGDRSLPGENLPGLSRLLEARRDIHRVTADERAAHA